MSLATWAPGSPNDNAESASAMRIIAGENGGWDDARPSDLEATLGFVVEWSKDHESKPDTPVPTASGELGKLRQIGSNALKNKTTAYLKELKANGKSFRWDLDFWHRGMAEGPKARYRPGVEKMKSLIREDGSIPGNIPRAGMPLEAAKILDGYLDKQSRIHSKFLADVERLRLGYLNKLSETRTDLEGRGLVSQVQTLDNEMNGCGQTGAEFYEHFSGSPLEEPGRDSRDL